MAENVFLTSGHTMNLGPKGGLAATGYGDWVPKGSPHAAIQVRVDGTGAVTATVTIEVSNDGLAPCDTVAGTITLTGTTTDSDGFVMQGSPWKYIRMHVTAISGTGATVSGVVGI